MKNKLVLILIVLSIFAMSFTMAAAPVGQKDVRMTGMYFVRNRLMVKFDVAGFTKRTDINASIVIDKTNFPLNCKYDDIKHLVCKVNRMNKYAGLPAKIWVGGTAFYTQVPFK